MMRLVLMAFLGLVMIMTCGGTGKTYLLETEDDVPNGEVNQRRYGAVNQRRYGAVNQRRYGAIAYPPTQGIITISA